MKLDNRLWVLISTVLAIAILAGGWFVGVDPQLQAAAASSAQLTAAETQNQALRDQLAELEEGKKNLADTEARVRELQAKIPPGVDGAEFIAQLDTIVASSGVTLQSFAFGTAMPYAPPVATTPVPAEATAPAEGSSAASEAEAPVAAAPEEDGPLPLTNPLITSENFVVVPITVQVQGSTASVQAFLHALQRGDRLALVTEVKSSRQAAADGSDADNYVMTVGGSIYVLRNAAAEAEAAAAASADADPEG